jgi:hypothetical protein
MERCVWCESAYELNESTASERVRTAVCSIECEENFIERSNEPLEFVDE